MNNYKDSDVFGSLVLFFGCVFLIVFAFFVGKGAATTEMRAEAVKHNAAHYVIKDINTGATEFVWYENNTPVEIR